MDYYIYKASDVVSFLPSIGWCLEFSYVLYLRPDYRYVGHNYTIGDPLSVPMVPRKTVAENARKLESSAIIIAHSHPGTVARPSKEDIASTMFYRRALADYGIRIIDHIIVAESNWYSMRAHGYFKRHVNRTV